MQKIQRNDIFLFISKILPHFYGIIVCMFLISIIWAIDFSLRPYLLKITLDHLIQIHSKDITQYITLPLLLYFFLTFFTTSISRLHDYLVDITMIPCFRKKIMSTIFSYILEYNNYYYQNNSAGSLANKINDLTYTLPDMIKLFIDRFFYYIITLIIAIYTLWKVHFNFALAMLIWAFIFTCISFSFSKKFHLFSRKWSEFKSTITGRLVDTLSNILSVKLFSQQKKELDSINDICEDASRAEQKLQWSYFWMWIFYGYSFVVTQGVCLYFLIKGNADGLITIGDFALVLSLNVSIVELLRSQTKEFSNFSQLLGKVTQALRTILIPLKIHDKEGAKDFIITAGKIVFENVQFYYQESHPLFENISLIIQPYQKIGIIGYSGSGKSTFINLILRLFDVTKGRILIDNQDISEVTQSSLRNSISIIPQDPSLFNRTLMENILYGKINASEEEGINAAKQAHAHSFISKLPKGYESTVGEHGIKLSGGERQRIAISRAIIKDSPILILDEATNQLDSLTENYIQESLWNLMQHKTTIVIAHRFSTLLRMDRILVFNQGKIVQDGTHTELIKKEGLYKNLWDSQNIHFNSFLPIKESP